MDVIPIKSIVDAVRNTLARGHDPHTACPWPADTPAARLYHDYCACYGNASGTPSPQQHLETTA